MTAHGANGVNGRAGRHDRAARHDRAGQHDSAGQHDPAGRHDRAASGPELTFFVHLNATAAWLALSPRERQQVIGEQVTPLLARHPDVTVRWFDAQAWSARPSDILMASTNDPRAWTLLFEQLRSTSLWAEPYFDVEQIVPGVEEAFAQRAGRHGSPLYSARHGSPD